MTRILLIIGIFEICRVKGLDGSGIIDKGHFFGRTSSEEDSENQDNGLQSSDVGYMPDSKNSASSWDFHNQHPFPEMILIQAANDFVTESHVFNHISDSSDSKQLPHGLDTWLADIVIGKDIKGLIKPIIHEIGYPVYKDYKIEIPYPQVQQQAQPYPVLIPMLHPVPFEVVKTIVKTIEKKVPTPVEKIIPVPVEKPVPFEVIKHVPVFVEKKIPIKIPVYKTIHHKVH